MIDPPNREVAFFSAARRLPALERAAFLDEACAGDAALRQRVEELLQASDKAGGFLESPAAVPPGPGGTIRGTVFPAEKLGDRVGRYKILQQIGQGGCGVVYMAEQEEPVRRRVALKVIKLGMDTKSVIARFEAERQALAMMDHPNIAKVLDAGATETGRPFFVMELVRGLKITDYCDQNNLATRERLDLFIQVCQAVQHAHQKGIIHRDLKPSNILVTLRDGVPVPKVIDFGIAKATSGQPLTDKTVFTAFEQFMGTPAYMSPEQAELNELGVDTRSDIYSLGILLYELLTGKTPFEAKELLAAGLDAMRRIIREKDPVRPSTRLSTMQESELTLTAKCRQANAPKLIHLIRGDLDWIVMKALEKDRVRRYETANGLARDVERYLRDEAVVARPPSNVYRLQKLVRRHKLTCAALAAVLAALMVGLVISTFLYVREKRAERAARIAEGKSREEAGFFQAMLNGVGPEVALGRDTTMLKEILQKTRARLGGGLQDQPDVEAELRATMAGIYQQLGDYPNAETEYRQALRLQEDISGKEDQTVMQLDNALAQTMICRGNLAGAETMIRQELARSQKLFGKVHPAVATSIHQLAEVLRERGDLAGAEGLFRQALAQWRQLQDPTNIAVVLNDLGLTLLDGGDLTGAQASLRESLNMRLKWLPPEHPGVAMALGNLALALWYQGDLAGAEATNRQVLQMRRNLFHDANAETASSLNNLALVLRDRGDFPPAEAMQREALAMVEKALGKDNPHTALARHNLAVLLRRRGAFAGDPVGLREALNLNPTDAMTCDAFANLLAAPALTPVAPGSGTAATGWRYQTTQPDPDWAATGYADAAWPSAPAVFGAATYVPRSANNSIISHTNLWLRRAFELSSVPPGKLVLRINRNQDAQIFLNGVEVVPTADWSDTEVLLPVAGEGQPRCAMGRNVLAVHCQDADGGVPIDVRVYVSQDKSAGRQSLLEELGAMMAKEPGRAELWGGRAGVLARLGRWREAAADLSKAIELKPSEPTGWYLLAPVLLEIGDRPGYELHRHQALARFGQPQGPLAAERIARLALLTPASGAELETAGKLADDAAAVESADGGLPWRQLAEGLAAYRRGSFSNAVAWMRKARATAGRPNLPGWSHEMERNVAAAGFLVEAMASHQMHDGGAARGALDRGIAIVGTQLPPPDSGDLGRDWPNWLAADILLRETKALIQ